MSKTIQIRNVPDALHRRLKASAAKLGISLSGYVLSEIREIAEKPTLADFRERLGRCEPQEFEVDTARMVREETRRAVI
jgi:plasmid stability protein